MATLQSIRDRGGVLVAIIIGLALLAFILGDFNLGVGRDKSIKTLMSDPKIFTELHEAITNQLKNKDDKQK